MEVVSAEEDSCSGKACLFVSHKIIPFYAKICTSDLHGHVTLRYIMIMFFMM